MAKVGRPTKYSEEMLEKAREYVDGGYMTQNHTIPSVTGLSLFLGVKKDTLYDWAEIHEAFSDTFEKVKATQEIVLLSGGLTGDFNSTITKLALHNHGYSDKAENTISAPEGISFNMNFGNGN